MYKAWRRLRHWSMPSSITLCSTPTHTSLLDSASNHPHPALFLVDSLAIFWNKCTEVRAVQWTEIWKFILLHYWSFRLGASNDAQNVRADTARGKDNDQQNLSKMIMWCCSIYCRVAQLKWSQLTFLFVKFE